MPLFEKLNPVHKETCQNCVLIAVRVAVNIICTSLRCSFQHSLMHEVAVTFIHLLVQYLHVMSMS